MKKLLLSLAGVAMAFAANATVYVVGAGEGLTWDLPGKAYEAGADGKYVIQVDNLTKFKVSLANTTSWDEYNAQAYATGNATFGSAVYPDGQTLPVEIWGEDQELPWTGNYTITLDLSAMTMTAKTTTPRPVDAPAVYIRGEMNGWGSDAAWQLTNKSWDNAAGTGTYTIDCTISKGVQFKIADSSWGNINYGGVENIIPDGTPVTLTHNSGTNLTLASDFTGTITFTITGTKMATVTFTPSGSVPSYPSELYLIGSFEGKDWNISDPLVMTNEGEGIYTAANVNIVYGADGATMGYFAITGVKGDDWNAVNAFRFGPADKDREAVVGNNPVDGSGDTSWSIVPGVYNMVFSYSTKTLQIEKVGDNPDQPQPDPDDPVDPTPVVGNTLYVIGAGEGLTWDLPGVPYTGENGVITFTVNNLTKFKASLNEAYDWDTYNAGAYATGLQTFTEAGVYPGSQTLTIEPWGEDQMLPYTATYTITYNFNDMTMTAKAATPAPAGAPAVYIRGAMNSWEPNPDWQMTNVSWDSATATGKYTFNCTESFAIEANAEFKFADDSWGKINYGYGEVVPSATDTVVVDLIFNSGENENIQLSENYTGTITLEILGNNMATASFSPNKSSAVSAIEAAEADAVYFDLQGRRVVNPDKGIYIRVANGKTTKVGK